MTFERVTAQKVGGGLFCAEWRGLRLRFCSEDILSHDTVEAPKDRHAESLFSIWSPGQVAAAGD